MGRFFSLRTLILIAVVLVHVIYNHTRFCLYQWARALFLTESFNPHEAFLCGMLWILALWLLSFYVSTALKSSSISNFFVIIALVIIECWAIFAFKWDVHNEIIQTYIITIPFSLFLGWGMIRAHLVLPMSGRMPTN